MNDTFQTHNTRETRWEGGLIVHRGQACLEMFWGRGRGVLVGNGLFDQALARSDPQFLLFSPLPSHHI